MITFKIANSEGKVPAIQSFIRCLSRIKSMKKEVGSGVGSGSGSPTLLIVIILIISETVALEIL
jgi:hypothetical protein